MIDIYRVADSENGLSNVEIKTALQASLCGRNLRNVLILPPDYTRFHSNAGLITNLFYHILLDMGARVDIMPALGTHVPLTQEQAQHMFGNIPFELFLPHDWRNDVTKIGEISGDYIASITERLWNQSIAVEVNRRILDPSYDLILSVGQVVPHEVIGMSNHSKNLFVGVGGHEMINASHMIGAIYGMERMMGRDHTPVRKMFDYAFEAFLKDLPILFALTVTTAPGGHIRTHGLFLGEGRECLTHAISLSRKKNIDFVSHGIRKCIVYLDESEFKSTWLGNKAVYRTRMAMANDGELIVLGPGIERFGEDTQIDLLIRKYGYSGRQTILSHFRDPACSDLRNNMGAAAHMIHGSSDGLFNITYAVRCISQSEIAGVGYAAVSYDHITQKYNPSKLQYGYNTMPDGEVVFFIPNPALGLWINRETFVE